MSTFSKSPKVSMYTVLHIQSKSGLGSMEAGETRGSRFWGIRYRRTIRMAYKGPRY